MLTKLLSYYQTSKHGRTGVSQFNSSSHINPELEARGRANSLRRRNANKPVTQPRRSSVFQFNDEDDDEECLANVNWEILLPELTQERLGLQATRASWQSHHTRLMRMSGYASRLQNLAQQSLSEQD